MPGIHFVSTFDSDPFVKSANAILSSVKNMASQVERAGGDMQNVMDGIFDGNKLGRGMNAFFDGIIENFGLSEKAAESFRTKAEAAINAIASSSDDATTKISKITTAIAQIASDSKQADMSGIGDTGVGKRSLEDIRTSTAFLIDELNSASEAADHLQDSISNKKGTGIEEKIRDIEDFEHALKEALKVADEAYNSQEEYIKAIQEELAVLTDNVNSSNDKGQIAQWNTEAEELSRKLTDAQNVLTQIKSVKDNTELKIESLGEVKDTVSAFDELNKKLQTYGNIIGNVKFGTDEANAAFQKYADNTKSASDSIKENLISIAKLAGLAFGLNEAKNFVDKIAETREYFQDIESSMKVFLGSVEKSEKFTKELKDYAWYNMFEFSDLAKASQQMIAYGQDVDSIIPRLDQLSNVAAGTHAGLLEMVDAYNRAKSTGVVDSNAMKSWAVKGVVIKDVLKEIGETAVGTTITFEQLNKVLDHITGEGGMFHDLMKEQLNNISAEKGQLEDNLASMYNEIGEKLQGAIIKYYKIQSDMVENYTEIAGGEKVIDFVVNVTESGMDLVAENWKELIALIKNGIVLYGSWRMALAASNAMQKVHVMWLQAGETAQLQNTLATKADIAAKGMATRSSVMLDNAIKKLNASMLMSPWTWAAAAIAAVTFVTWKLVTADDAETAARKRAIGAMEGYEQKLNDLKDRANSYIAVLKDDNATDYEKMKAWENLKKEMPELTEKYDRLTIAKMDMSEANKKVSETAEDIEFEEAKANVEKYQKALDEARKREQEYLSSSTPDPQGTIAKRISDAIADAEQNLKVYRDKYNEILEIRNKVDEENKPIEIKVQEANDNYNAKKDILDFYDKAIMLAHEVETATNDQDYSEAVNNFQSYIDKLEEEIKELKKEEDENPINEKIRIEREEKERMKNELLSLKAEWRGVFSSPIPVWFSVKFQTAKDEEEAARTAAHEGMHFVENIIGREVYDGKRGHWEADKQEVVGFQTTFKAVRQEFNDAKKDFDVISKNAKKGLETFVANVDGKLRVVKKSTKDARLATDDDFTKIKQTYDAASQAFKQRGGDPSGKAAQKLAKQQADANAKQLQDQWKHEEAMADLEEKAQRARTAASIAGIQNQAERERKEREAQYRQSLEDLKNQEEDIYKTIYEQRKRAYETANKDKKYESTEAGQAGYLTEDAREAMRNSFNDEEHKQFDLNQRYYRAEREKTEAEFSRYTLERYRNEAQAMRDYLKEYGSYEQQRLAITEEYEQKIREARTEGEKLQLQKQMEQAQANLSLTSITGGIDWKAVFGGVENMTTEMMRTLTDQLKVWQQSPEYANADAGTKQQVAQMLSDMRQFIGSDMSVTWKTLATDIANFDRSVAAYQSAQEAEKPFAKAYEEASKRQQEASDKLKDAQDKAKEAADKFLDLLDKLPTGEATQEEVDYAKNESIAAESDVKTFTQALKDATDQTDVARKNLLPYSKATVVAKKDVKSFGQKVNETSDELTNYVGVLSTTLANSSWLDASGVKSASGDIDSFIGALRKGIGDGSMKKAGMEGAAKVLANDVLPVVDNVGDSIMGTFTQGFLGVIGMIGQAAKFILSLANSIKEFVTSILDSISELLRFEWLKDFVLSIVDSIVNLVDTIFDLPETLYKLVESIITKGIGGLLSGILNRIGSIFGIGNLAEKHEKEYQENLQEITDSLDVNTEALQRNTEALKNQQHEIPSQLATIRDAALKNLEDAQEDRIKAAKAIASDNFSGSWYKAWSDGYHSWNVERNGYDFSNFNRILRENGSSRQITGVGSIFELSPEDIDLIRRLDPHGWNKLFEDIDSKRDPLEIKKYLEEFADAKDQGLEIWREWAEGITQVSFDSLRSNFKSSILDMEKDAEDFLDDFTKMMAEATLDLAFNIKGADGKSFNEQLEEWQVRWAKRIESGEDLTQDEVRQQREEYEQLVAEALKIRDDVKKVTGYGENTSSSLDKSASAVAADKITYEQADQIEGQLTAIQIAHEQENEWLRQIYGVINERMGTGSPTITMDAMPAISQPLLDSGIGEQIAAYIEMLNSIVSPNGTDVRDIRNMMVTTNEYLLDIKKSNRELVSHFDERMTTIYNLIEERL